MRKKGDVGFVGEVETWEHVRNECRVGRAKKCGGGRNEAGGKNVAGGRNVAGDSRLDFGRGGGEREVDESVGKRKKGKGRAEG